MMRPVLRSLSILLALAACWSLPSIGATVPVITI